MVNPTIQKYLSVYAEPEIMALSVPVPSSLTSPIPPQSSYSKSESLNAYLVLPIYDETIDSLLPFLEIPFSFGAQGTGTSKTIVMIWVFNCPDGSLENADECARVRTQKVMNEVLGRFSFQALSEQAFFSQLSPSLSLYLLDYCSPGKELPAKQGVGLARKSGMDLALKLAVDYATSSGRALPWIHSCDADVTLPPDYFDIPEPAPDIAACLYPFRHLPEPGYELAMALYGLSLHYYVDRLKWAGSPYGFYSIGSLITVNPLSYAQVRGVPKRAGGEDFYLLNKLAKVGKIISLDHPTLNIEGRPSHRVPFGTGPALNKLHAMSDPVNDYRYYHPDSFVALRAVLQAVDQAEQGFISTEQFFLQLSDGIDSKLAVHARDTLSMLNIEKAMRHLAGFSDKTQFKRAFHTWFDGFLTLRFVHLMRDQGYHSVSLQGLRNASFIGSESLRHHFDSIESL